MTAKKKTFDPSAVRTWILLGVTIVITLSGIFGWFNHQRLEIVKLENKIGILEMNAISFKTIDKLDNRVIRLEAVK